MALCFMGVTRGEPTGEMRGKERGACFSSVKRDDARRRSAAKMKGLFRQSFFSLDPPAPYLSPSMTLGFARSRNILPLRRSAPPPLTRGGMLNPPGALGLPLSGGLSPPSGCYPSGCISVPNKDTAKRPPMAVFCSGSPGRARTYNPSVNSCQKQSIENNDEV